MQTKVASKLQQKDTENITHLPDTIK